MMLMLTSSSPMATMARAGAVLVKLGREDVGRKLIDEAARDAAQLPVVNRGSYHRALVSGILAP